MTIRYCDLVQKTFVLPTDATVLLQDVEEYEGPYIVKPIGGTRGRGIRVLPTVTEAEIKKMGRMVVQR